MQAFTVGELAPENEKSLIFHSREAAETECEDTGENKEDIQEVIIFPEKELKERLNTISSAISYIRHGDVPNLQQHPQITHSQSLIQLLIEDIDKTDFSF